MADQNAPTSPRRVRAAARREEVLRLRCAGLSYRQIADQLGMSPAGVQKSLVKALQEHKDVSDQFRSELRKIQAEQLREMLRAIWTRVEQADLDAIQTTLRILERLSKLFGLDTAGQVINVNAEISTKPTLEQLIDLVRPKDVAPSNSAE